MIQHDYCNLGEEEMAYVSLSQSRAYDKDIYSTDPRRISAVIEDVRALTNANNYGLIFWSHGTGIDPSFSTHDTRSDCDEMVFSETRHSFYSFGSDNNPEKDKGYYDEIDIDELCRCDTGWGV